MATAREAEQRSMIEYEPTDERRVVSLRRQLDLQDTDEPA
jgi:hypothetical protein